MFCPICTRPTFKVDWAYGWSEVIDAMLECKLLMWTLDGQALSRGTSVVGLICRSCAPKAVIIVDFSIVCCPNIIEASVN